MDPFEQLPFLSTNQHPREYDTISMFITRTATQIKIQAKLPLFIWRENTFFWKKRHPSIFRLSWLMVENHVSLHAQVKSYEQVYDVQKS